MLLEYIYDGVTSESVHHRDVCWKLHLEIIAPYNPPDDYDDNDDDYNDNDDDYDDNDDDNDGGVYEGFIEWA